MSVQNGLRYGSLLRAQLCTAKVMKDTVVCMSRITPSYTGPSTVVCRRDVSIDRARHIERIVTAGQESCFLQGHALTYTSKSCIAILIVIED